ncbi:hypothetical protein PC112_g22766 [Phytophthora cactorum]|nr:hypothetical protein PC112_g22766 [Phytophthora cactorum]
MRRRRSPSSVYRRSQRQEYKKGIYVELSTGTLLDENEASVRQNIVPACLVKRVRRRQTIALVMARDRASPVR